MDIDMDEVPKGYMRNATGGLDLISKVKEIDLLRNEMVLEIVRESINEGYRLKRMKQRFFETINAFVDLSAEKYGVKCGGKKGNMTFMSHDGQYKIIVAVNENIVFDERLQIAKNLIDECIADWSQDSRDEIKALVQDAFYVGKSGNLNKNRILGLRRLDIHDERWMKAMQAISDSVQVDGSKQYIRIYQRNKSDRDKYDLVILDVATL